MEVGGRDEAAADPCEGIGTHTIRSHAPLHASTLCAQPRTHTALALTLALTQSRPTLDVILTSTCTRTQVIDTSGSMRTKEVERALRAPPPPTPLSPSPSSSPAPAPRTSSTRMASPRRMTSCYHPRHQAPLPRRLPIAALRPRVRPPTHSMPTSCGIVGAVTTPSLMPSTPDWCGRSSPRARPRTTCSPSSALAATPP